MERALRYAGVGSSRKGLAVPSLVQDSGSDRPRKDFPRGALISRRKIKKLPRHIRNRLMTLLGPPAPRPGAAPIAARVRRRESRKTTLGRIFHAGTSRPDVKSQRCQTWGKTRGKSRNKRHGQYNSVTCVKNGRSERIRTSDPLLPKQVRYQAALHSDLSIHATARPSAMRERLPYIEAIPPRQANFPSHAQARQLQRCAHPTMVRRALGRRQAVRQRILIPPYGGSNPPAPASQSIQERLFSPERKMGRTRHRQRPVRRHLWFRTFTQNETEIAEGVLRTSIKPSD